MTTEVCTEYVTQDIWSSVYIQLCFPSDGVTHHIWAIYRHLYVFLSLSVLDYLWIIVF